jgi:hypothetical protein
VKARIVGAWVISVVSLFFLLVSASGGIVRGDLNFYDVVFFIVATAGGGLGSSTWGRTEKSKVGLAGGILGYIVAGGFLIIMLMSM